MESLARYIIRAPFSQEKMQYIDKEGTIIHAAKDDNDRKVFDAPEWPAAMCSHVPNRGGTDGPLLQILRHYQLLQFKW